MVSVPCRALSVSGSCSSSRIASGMLASACSPATGSSCSLAGRQLASRKCSSFQPLAGTSSCSPGSCPWPSAQRAACCQACCCSPTLRSTGDCQRTQHGTASRLAQALRKDQATTWVPAGSSSAVSLLAGRLSLTAASRSTRKARPFQASTGCVCCADTGSIASRSLRHCASAVCSSVRRSPRSCVTCWARTMASSPRQLSSASSAMMDRATISSIRVKPRAGRGRQEGRCISTTCPEWSTGAAAAGPAPAPAHQCAGSADSAWCAH